MADQTERAFQKQPTIFLNKKGGLKPSESRFFCNPGLGFKIPTEAKIANYVDKKCPFTGKVNIIFISSRLDLIIYLSFIIYGVGRSPSVVVS